MFEAIYPFYHCDPPVQAACRMTQAVVLARLEQPPPNATYFAILLLEPNALAAGVSRRIVMSGGAEASAYRSE